MAAVSQVDHEDRVYEFAWHYVNTCAGQKGAAYSRACGEYKTAKAGSSFYKRHQDKIESLIQQFRAENKARYPQIRDNNIAMLSDIAAQATRNSDRIAAIKELNNMCGYNNQNINVNGRVDSEIEITISNL